jgi:hypothetical protein
LTNGTAYTFTVTATTDGGTGPASGPTAPITPAAAPNPPTGVSASPSCQLLVIGPEVTVSWTAGTSSGITSYLILRGSSPGNLATITSVSAGTTSYSDTSVTGLATTYWYAVEAVAPGGDAVSGPVSATTPGFCL